MTTHARESRVVSPAFRLFERRYVAYPRIALPKSMSTNFRPQTPAISPIYLASAQDRNLPPCPLQPERQQTAPIFDGERSVFQRKRPTAITVRVR